MFRATDQAPSLLYAALGAAVMGIWSTTATSAGGAIQQQRWYGMLELLVAAPSRLILVLAPITVAIAGIGVYSIASTLLWGRLLFGDPAAHRTPAAVRDLDPGGRPLDRPARARARLDARPLPLGELASQALEYPIWTITGMLIPLSLLPGWVQPDRLAARADLGHARRSATPRSAATSASRSSSASLLSVAYTAISALLLAPLRTAGPRPRDALADMRTWLRIFFIGGAISFRALFSWIRPVGLHPDARSLGPTTQILFFAYLGRTAHLESDDGSSSATPSSRRRSPRCSGWASRSTASAGRRRSSAVLATPAEPRCPLPRPRAAGARQRGGRRPRPASSAARCCSASACRGLRCPRSRSSCCSRRSRAPGLGMLTGAVGLRMRDVPIIANLTMAVLLIFCGVNVPLDKLPDWMHDDRARRCRSRTRSRRRGRSPTARRSTSVADAVLTSSSRSAPAISLAGSG